MVEGQDAPGENRLPGMVERAVYIGAAHELHIRIIGGELLKATIPNDGSAAAYVEGAPVTLHLPADGLRVLPPTSAPA
jgi:hypothetical protein